jgi:hypothetical protein
VVQEDTIKPLVMYTAAPRKQMHNNNNNNNNNNKGKVVPVL